MYFTVRGKNIDYSTLGAGWVAGACDEEKLYHHAMIMEYQYDDITFARVPTSYLIKIFTLKINL
jgi:hypothetical protein